MARNRLGLHALVWVGGWSREECQIAVESTRKSGFDLIEIPALDPSSIDVAHTKQVLADNGIEAACSLGLSFDADINNEDPAVVKRGLDRLLSALKVVEGLEGDYLGGVVYSALGKYTRPASELARANAVASIKVLAKTAADSGITIGLEPVNRYESNLINTAQQALDFISDAGESNVKVHLDVYHMNIEEVNFADPVRICGDQLGYVHLGESHRGYIGTGTINFPEFFGALAAIGYKGTLTFESFSSAIVHPDLSSTLAIWRNLWTDNMDLATKAKSFVDAGLRSVGM